MAEVGIRDTALTPGTGCLTGELARAESKTLRYRLLHTAARIIHRGRRTILRLPKHWPWAPDLGAAY